MTRPPRPTEATRESINIPERRSYLIRQDDYPHPLCTWNYHPEWEIHFIPHARGYTYVGDHIGSFEPGHIALCGSNLPHNWVSPGLVQPGRDYVLQFDAPNLMQNGHGVAELRCLAKLAPLAERGIALTGQAEARAGALMIQLLTSPPAIGLGLFAEILDIFAQTDERRLLASPGFASGYAHLARGRHAKIDRAIQHIQANPSVSMQEAADLAGANPSTFSRSFKALTGTTFSSYQRAIRISRACTMLAETRDAVTDICFESGYTNLSNFNRAFLQETGMTPREYRKVSNIRTTSQLRTD
ncbi:AraC family transcriptional regulator [Thioclava sp. SK-1]|nr:AraC family transcriptional regulator [Thioclava sp. SK-1]